MAVVRYYALRSLTGGVTLNQQITRNLPLSTNGLTRDRSVFKSGHVSIARLRETLFYAAEVSWQCQSIPLRGTTQTQLDLVMFLDSVDRGEVFEFSPYQVVGDTISWANACCEDQGYTESRVLPIGGTGTNGKGAGDYFQYGFRIVMEQT